MINQQNKIEHAVFWDGFLTVLLMYNCLSCVYNSDDQSCLHIFLRSLNIFICVLHILRVYYELTMWPAPRWLDSSVGRALYRYHRGHGFESHSDWMFSGSNFTTAEIVCITVMISHDFISFSAVQICDLSYINLQFFSLIHKQKETKEIMSIGCWISDLN